MPAWVGSEPKWERAKKLARKQYPKAKGSRFWRLTAGIYKKMGGAMKKAGLLKGASQGSSHKNHRYLQRTRGPGKWQYEYNTDDTEDDEDADTEAENHPAPKPEDDASGTAEGFEPKSSTAPASKPLNLKLDVGQSILRDAQPEDLQEKSIVLWRCLDLPSLDAVRQKGQLVGTEPDGGSILSGTRVGALSLADGNKTEHEDALVAISVKPDALEPVPPAKTVEQSLFPDNPGMSAAKVIGNIPANTIVGIVQEGDTLWPSELPDENPDQDQVSGGEETAAPIQCSVRAVYLGRRS